MDTHPALPWRDAASSKDATIETVLDGYDEYYLRLMKIVTNLSSNPGVLKLQMCKNTCRRTE